jgi:hypothetical protein
VTGQVPAGRQAVPESRRREQVFVTNRQVLLLVAVVVGVLLVPCAAALFLGPGWFLMPYSPPNPTPSAFYAACGDLGAVLERAVPAGGLTLEPPGERGSGMSAGPGRMKANVRQSRAVQCRPEDLGKVLPALEAEFRRLARENGASVTEAGEGKGPAGNRMDFALRYTAGSARGTVSASLGEGQPVPGKPDVESYPLTVQVEESVP